MTDDLHALGDALERSAAADLRSAPRPAPRRRRTRRLVIGAVAAAVLIPGIAFGVSQLTVDEETVAASLPAGTLSLMGTDPTCTVVTEGVEYHCTLARPPAPEVEDWAGTVEPTVGADSRVNGGCRAEDSAGMTWRCYLGEAAVEQEIIGPGFLGQRVNGPGVG